jgi:hypothetical protein
MIESYRYIVFLLPIIRALSFVVRGKAARIRLIGLPSNMCLVSLGLQAYSQSPLSKTRILQNLILQIEVFVN